MSLELVGFIVHELPSGPFYLLLALAAVQEAIGRHFGDLVRIDGGQRDQRVGHVVGGLLGLAVVALGGLLVLLGLGRLLLLFFRRRRRRLLLLLLLFVLVGLVVRAGRVAARVRRRAALVRARLLALLLGLRIGPCRVGSVFNTKLANSSKLVSHEDGRYLWPGSWGPARHS